MASAAGVRGIRETRPHDIRGRFVCPADVAMRCRRNHTISKMYLNEIQTPTTTNNVPVIVLAHHSIFERTL